jgi:hypothetical protein
MLVDVVGIAIGFSRCGSENGYKSPGAAKPQNGNARTWRGRPPPKSTRFFPCSPCAFFRGISSRLKNEEYRSDIDFDIAAVFLELLGDKGV